MRVRVEVVGRPLNLRGPQFAVGERLFLDLDNPRHRECLDSNWVRRVDDDASARPATVATTDVPAPPADRMLREPVESRAAVGGYRRGRGK